MVGTLKAVVGSFAVINIFSVGAQQYVRVGSCCPSVPYESLHCNRDTNAQYNISQSRSGLCSNSYLALITDSFPF